MWIETQYGEEILNSEYIVGIMHEADCREPKDILGAYKLYAVIEILNEVGKHYIFESDSKYEVEKQYKRLIQSINDGCDFISFVEIE